MAVSLDGRDRTGSDDGIVLWPASGITAITAIVITPAAGKKLKVYYLSYNPLADGEVYFRFGLAGTPILRNNVTANSVIAKDFHGKLIEGLIDESLYLVTSVNTIWNAFYRDSFPNL